MGCSAEAWVSHVLSSRLSSRPLGWSATYVAKMSKLRAYMANGGKVYDLVKYKKEKEQRMLQEEIRRDVDKQIKKRQKMYTDVWNHETIAASIGEVTGVYHLTKKLRGICG